MNEIENEGQSTPLSQLEVPPVLHGHVAYVESLNAVTDCMSRLAVHEGSAIGVSAKRLRNRMAAIAIHLRDAGSCVLCQTARSGGLQRFESAFVNAYARYRESVHAKSSSSLRLVSVNLSADDTIGQDGELVLLPTCLDLLCTKLGLPAEQAA